MNISKQIIFFALLASNIAMYPAEIEIQEKTFYQKTKKFIEKNNEVITKSAFITGIAAVFWGCYRSWLKRENNLFLKILEESDLIYDYNPKEGKISDYRQSNEILVFSDAEIVKESVISLHTSESFAIKNPVLRFFAIKAHEVSLEKDIYVTPYTFVATKVIKDTQVVARFRCAVNKEKNTALIYSTTFLDTGCEEKIHQVLVEEMKKYLNETYPNIVIKQNVQRSENEEFFRKNSLHRTY